MQVRHTVAQTALVLSALALLPGVIMAPRPEPRLTTKKHATKADDDKAKALPSFLMLLGDDIGWADFAWNNGTANTPRTLAWSTRPGSILMQDSHSGGTCCSPTRASILTGRVSQRDCVITTYDCSDPTECTPSFEFAPQRTFTIGDAARAASPAYVSHHWGKCKYSSHLQLVPCVC
jgi:arylsulfatase A-like enzyme